MAENEIFKSGKMSVDVAPRTVGILKTSIQFSTQDQGTAKLIFSLSKDGLPLPLSSAATAKIFLRMADGSVFEKIVSIVDQINGKLEYVLEEEISHPGLAKGELNINYANGQALSVCKFSFNIDASLMDQDIVPLAEYYVKDFNTLQSDIEQRAAVINVTVDEMQEKVDAFESTAVTLDPRLTTVEEKVATATVQLADTVKKHGDKVSVKEYDNLVINGDWTNAFQNAFQNATFVDVPDGDYMINDQILKNTGKKLVLTISKGANFKAGNSFPTGKSLFKVDGLERFVLNGLIMDGNWSYRGFADWTNYIHGIEVKNITKKVTIKECEISNYPSIAIQVVNSNNVHISGNVIESGQFHGIEVKDCVFSHIGRNRILGIGNAGVDPIKGGIGVLVTKGQKAYIYRNDVSNMSDTAMKTEGTDHVIFSGNTAVDSGKDGIKIMSHSSRFPSFAKVINNTVLRLNEWRPDGTSLIAIQSIKKSIVQGNILEGGNKTGSQVENGVRVNSIDGVVYSEDSTVRNNVIKNTNSESIYIDKVKKISITDNSTDHGINVINSLSSLKVKGNSLTPVSVKSTIVGIQVFNSVNVDISNNEISKFLNGILVSPGLLTKRITLKDNDISDLDGYPIRVKNYGTDLAVINLLDISDNRMINVAQVNNISEAISVSILNSNFKFLKLRDNLLQSEGTGTISYMFQVLDTGTNITNAILKDNVSNSNKQVLKNKITNILEQVVA
ncbi:BppU family phage baseplate upper protein [Bacillus sp. ISL-34]|uniref:BppU family phage baseplate upper protein n=1 Tax=Bacillus sp. ISL-34 TaxID=2819121 RepID=UPI001BE51226|nr:BppU family phage baseplate upper protein [Bacillus sp. ISL-34]MBT2647206.1 BppU family phage baseplate upper protein [Bacillus sp. ISL-34]